MRIVYQTVKRITNEILGVKGLRDRSVVIRVEGGGRVRWIFVATTQPLRDPSLKYIGFFNTPTPLLLSKLTVEDFMYYVLTRFQLLYYIKKLIFYRNCGAASVAECNKVI